MKAKKKEELRNEIWQINEILLMAQSSFRITKYLLRPDIPLAAEFITQSIYLQYSIRMNWRLTVIELSKLLATNKDRDRYNIHHFIKKLKKDGHFGDAKKTADKFNALELHDPDKWEKDIAQWEARLLSEKPVIDNLLLQRDKLYAHTDPDHKTVVNNITIVQIEDLIMVARDIIRAIYLSVFESGISFEPIGDPVLNLKSLVDTLAKEKEARLAPLYKLAKDVGLDDI